MTAQTVDEVPTFFANIVSNTYRGDEITLEFRHYIEPHRELSQKVGAGKPLPALDWPTVYKQDPVARVVLTYHAAKALQEWLSQHLPTITKFRREQQ